ncbi:MAG: VTT domain-containing protein [Pseudomonadota bacterium]
MRTEAARLRRRLLALGGVALLLLALGAAWSWSPLHDWLDLGRIVAGLRRLGQGYGPLAAIGGVALALACAVPLTFLTLVAIVAFGPWTGLACAMPGALAGAALSYALGAALGSEAVARLGGARVNRLSTELARRGVLAIVLVRLTPVAPFAIVNMAAGAARIRLRDLLLGTAIGMLPSSVFMMVFVERIVAGLAEPGRFGLWLLALSVLLLAAGGWALRRWLRPAGP